MRVCSKPCPNCLYSDDRIVPEERADQIIEHCKNEGSHFVCHKASMENEEIVCYNFWKNHKDYSPPLQLADRFGYIKFVNMPDSKKLTPYKDYGNI